VVEPVGSRVRSLVVHGHELLLPPGGDPLLAGCYPMAPWAGRLGRGRFSFAGEVLEVPVDLPPHAIHGLGTNRVWAATGEGFELDLAGSWALGGQVATRFELVEGALSMDLTVVAGHRSMPVALGWHPCFRRRLDGGAPLELGFVADHWWPRGADGLPTGATAAPPPGPWDDCFGGVEQPPTLSWPDGPRVRLEADTDIWVVFDERDETVCVEPQTAPPNAFNNGTAAVLDPGETATLRFSIRWVEPG
jgi:galactose mutarotase-like enzyme